MARAKRGTRKHGHARRVEIYGAVFTVVLGGALHFVYGWTGGSFLVGLVAPVNESVWEHTKLLLTPVLLFALVEGARFGWGARLAKAKLLELAVGILFLVSFYYTYTGALGVESLAVDIGSFALAAAIGKDISFRVLTAPKRRERYGWLYAVGLVALCAFFAWMTIDPFRVPLFKDGPSGTYGIERTR